MPNSSKELANVANRTKAATLVLYHIANTGCDQVGTQACRDAGSKMQPLAEIRKLYKGGVVAARDLDVLTGMRPKRVGRTAQPSV